MTDLSNEVTEEEVEAQLPKPVGYRVLVAMPEVDDTYGSSGIIKSSKEMHNEHIMSIMGLVLVPILIKSASLQGRGVNKVTT